MTQEKAPQNTEHRKQKSKSHPSSGSVYKAIQRHGLQQTPTQMTCGKLPVIKSVTCYLKFKENIEQNS